MAANLIYLKEPKPAAARSTTSRRRRGEDDPRWELIRQLIELQKIQGSSG